LKQALWLASTYHARSLDDQVIMPACQVCDVCACACVRVCVCVSVRAYLRGNLSNCVRALCLPQVSKALPPF